MATSLVEPFSIVLLIVLRSYDSIMNVRQSSEGAVMAVETGRVALVTGASAGIGEAAARALVGAGFTVYGTSRRAAGETRAGVVFLPLDVTDDGSVAAVVRGVLERSGRIDVLV